MLSRIYFDLGIQDSSPGESQKTKSFLVKLFNIKMENMNHFPPLGAGRHNSSSILQPDQNVTMINVRQQKGDISLKFLVARLKILLAQRNI